MNKFQVLFCLNKLRNLKTESHSLSDFSYKTDLDTLEAMLCGYLGITLPNQMITLTDYYYLRTTYKWNVNYNNNNKLNYSELSFKDTLTQDFFEFFYYVNRIRKKTNFF